jgi:hypothetical protein
MADRHHPSPAHGETPHDQVTVSHEESDVNVRAIFGFGVGLIAVAVAIHVLVWVLLLFFEARASREATVEFPLAVQQESRVPPEPRLQTNPREDLRLLREAEDQTLNSYGWVDRNAGVVRIPIDEAIKRTLERGLPARTGAQTP